MPVLKRPEKPLAEPYSVNEHRFWRFHSANPRVYVLFCEYAQMLIERGFSHYSSDAILHRIRWHYTVETKAEDPFKLNDNHTAYYARLWLRDHPGHDNFFECRVITNPPMPTNVLDWDTYRPVFKRRRKP